MANTNPNNIKIALLVIFTLLIAILGLSYLKGTPLFSKDVNYYADFDKAFGLQKSDNVFLLGVPVGQVEDIEFIGNYSQVRIYFSVNKSISMSTDTKVQINPAVPGIGSPSINLLLGKESSLIPIGGEVGTSASSGFTDQAQSIAGKLEPTLDNINQLVTNLDKTVTSINTLFEGQNKTNLESSISQLNQTLANFNKVGENVNHTVSNSSQKLDHLFGNLTSISDNLVKNQDKINTIFNNLSSTTDQLTALELKKTFDQLDATLANLNGTLSKINEGDGSLSLLINDAELYNNLNDAARDLDRLILQIKENPDEFLPDISVF